MSFSKNRSGVPYLKSDMPRVLLPGEPDTTSPEKKQEVMNAVQQTMENIMAKHNTVVLHMLRQMMVSVFGPGMEKVLNRVSPQGPSAETGESSVVVNGQLAQDASAQPPPQSTGVSQSSSRTLIRQCPIGLLMENWHSALWSSTWLYLQDSPSK
jgi:hypothetical protein